MSPRTPAVTPTLSQGERGAYLIRSLFLDMSPLPPPALTPALSQGEKE